MGEKAKWLICSGAGEFLFASAALLAAGFDAGIEWEPVPARACARLLGEQGSPTAPNVLVADGCFRDNPVDVIRALSDATAGFGVLSVKDAGMAAGFISDRPGVIAVEPSGLSRALISLAGSGDRDEAATAGADAVPDPAGGIEGCERRGLPDSSRNPSVETARGLAPGLGPSSDGASDVVACPRDDAVAGVVGGPMPVPGGIRPRGWPTRPSVGDCVADDLEEPRCDVGVGYGAGERLTVQPDRVPPGHRSEGRVVLGVQTEPVVYTPVLNLPQFDCEVAGQDAHIPTICVSSARGGVGKTSLAVLMALSLARSGYAVSLIDLDYQFGTCLGYLGASETDGLMEGTHLPERVRMDAQKLARCRATPESRLAAYEFCRSPEQAEVLAPMTAKLLRSARAGSDVAVVDLPTGVNETVVQALDLADRCLIVSDQRAFSIESIAAQQALYSRMGFERTKLVAVANRCDPRHRDETYLSRVEFESQVPAVLRVADGGAEVMQMLSLGNAGELVSMRNRFALSVSDLALRICADLGCRPSEAVVRPAFRPVATRQSPGLSSLFGKGKRERRAEVEPCPF